MGHRNRNDRTRHVRRSSGGVLIAALALVFFVSASHLSAQQVTSQSRVRVESDELAPAPTVLQRVDGAFAPVVKVSR